MEAKAITGELLSPPDAFNAMAEIERSRAVQETLGSLAIAQRMPRNEVDCEVKILRECDRYELAEQASYSYPRGKEQISGPTIRLAEVVIRHWRNADYGFRQLEATKTNSTFEAFCFDKETNTKVSRTFFVEHWIALKDGKRKVLTDPRDIYELGANQAQRRVRACILEIIPGYVMEKAILRCRETLKKGNGIPLRDRVVRMAEAYQAKFSVTTGQLEKRLGHELGLMTADEFVSYWEIFKSLDGGNSRPGDWFDGITEADRAATKLEDLFET